MRKWIMTLPILALACVLHAQETNSPAKPSTLADCLTLSRERNATLANVRLDQGIADATVTQARAEAIPHAKLTAGYTRLDELQTMDLGGVTTTMGTLDNYSAGLELSQLLYSGGRVGAALKAAKLSRGYYDYACDDAGAALRRDVASSFNDILLARAAAKVALGSLAQMESVLTQEQVRQTNGVASEFDVITARVRVANQKPNVIRARNQESLALEYLKRILRVDDEGFDITGELEFVPVRMVLGDLCRLALERKPALHQYELAVRLREEDMAASKAGYYPTLNSFFNYSGANSYGYVTYTDQLQWHWTAGVSASWSILDGGLTTGTVRAKRLEWAKAKNTLEDLRNITVIEVRQAYLDMTRAVETIDAGRGNVDLAGKALLIAQTKHDVGMATSLEFSDANVNLRLAQLTLYSALHEHMNAVERLRYAAGLKDDEAFSTVDAGEVK